MIKPQLDFQPRAIGFDVAGTLYFCPELDLSVDEQAERVLADALGCDLDEARSRLSVQRGENLRQYGDKSKVRALEAMGVPRAAFHDAVSRLDAVEFLRDAPLVDQLFAEIRRHQIKIGILSNFRRALVDRILAQLGVGPALIDATICEDNALPIKPSPVPFIELAKRLGTSPRDMLFVGDSLSKDLAPAKSVGMRTVLVENSKPDGDADSADWRIGNARELIQLIQR